MRFFAESPITVKALGAGIKSVNPQYKLDGGDLMVGSDVVAEIVVDSAGSDMFTEEMNARLYAVQQVGGQAAQWVISRLQSTQSIVSIKIDPSVNWDLLGPLWTTLAGMATGLTQVDGQGVYDGANLIMQMA